MPENTLANEAVASAIPSSRPIVTTLAPSVVAMNTGSRLWTSSDEVSISSDTAPSAQIPPGRRKTGDGVAGEGGIAPIMPRQRAPASRGAGTRAPR